MGGLCRCSEYWRDVVCSGYEKRDDVHVREHTHNVRKSLVWHTHSTQTTERGIKFQADTWDPAPARACCVASTQQQQQYLSSSIPSPPHLHLQPLYHSGERRHCPWQSPPRPYSR